MNARRFSFVNRQRVRRLRLRQNLRHLPEDSRPRLEALLAHATRVRREAREIWARLFRE